MFNSICLMRASTGTFISAVTNGLTTPSSVRRVALEPSDRVLQADVRPPLARSPMEHRNSRQTRRVSSQRGREPTGLAGFDPHVRRTFGHPPFAAIAR
jgi:hypothetical protein